MLMSFTSSTVSVQVDPPGADVLILMQCFQSDTLYHETYINETYAIITVIISKQLKKTHMGL